MFRRPPAVHWLLNHPQLREDVSVLGRETVKEVIRRRLAELRQRREDLPEPEALVAELHRHLARWRRPSYPAVINATGVLIHTNLGRSPRLTAASEGYLALELELETGQRGERLAPVREKLCRYFGAEDALVVTNNAAAVLLLLAAHARGREVIVSRGELIEIGGSFRLPEVMKEAGAILVEVGCTNRTHLADYRKAITPNTCAILHVHRSNFALTGFVTNPQVAELAHLARQAGVALWVDQGSGCHVDLRPFGLNPEPTVSQLLNAGADVVMFSGDKLLAGPQAGILVGKAQTLAPLRQHPLRRALRPDKAALVTLAATLDAYLAGDLTRVPFYALLAQKPEELRRRARCLAGRLSREGVPAKVVPTRAVVGGGTTPGQTLPSWAVALPEDAALARQLRLGNPPVVARQEQGLLLLDLRAVFPHQDRLLLTAVVSSWHHPAR
ncbi:MAG: L-seryl-tRNA(Sec) selenium transferase [Thermoanaerobaculum sp.]|nr:L-seryl-tRNA(Sec) selenium transferase [Thermoanaerobaculum sp.]